MGPAGVIRVGGMSRRCRRDRDQQDTRPTPEIRCHCMAPFETLGHFPRPRGLQNRARAPITRLLVIRTPKVHDGQA